jgi:hypothetical protein
MTYHIMKVTLFRHDEDNNVIIFDYTEDVTVQDLKEYRKLIKDKFQAKRVAFIYEQIP